MKWKWFFAFHPVAGGCGRVWGYFTAALSTDQKLHAYFSKNSNQPTSRVHYENKMRLLRWRTLGRLSIMHVKTQLNVEVRLVYGPCKQNDQCNICYFTSRYYERIYRIKTSRVTVVYIRIAPQMLLPYTAIINPLKEKLTILSSSANRFHSRGRSRIDLHKSTLYFTRIGISFSNRWMKYRSALRYYFCTFSMWSTRRTVQYLRIPKFQSKIGTPTV